MGPGAPRGGRAPGGRAGGAGRRTGGRGARPLSGQLGTGRRGLPRPGCVGGHVPGALLIAPHSQQDEGPWSPGKLQRWELHTPAPPGRAGAAVGDRRARLTGGASVEVVVVLGHVGQDTQPVRHLQSHHVLCVQQGRDAQLLLRHTEGLGEGQPPAPPEGGREGPGAGVPLGAQKGLASRRQLRSASVYPATKD